MNAPSTQKYRKKYKTCHFIFKYSLIIPFCDPSIARRTNNLLKETTSLFEENTQDFKKTLLKCLGRIFYLAIVCKQKMCT